MIFDNDSATFTYRKSVRNALWCVVWWLMVSQMRWKWTEMCTGTKIATATQELIQCRHEFPPSEQRHPVLRIAQEEITTITGMKIVQQQGKVIRVKIWRIMPFKKWHNWCRERPVSNWSQQRINFWKNIEKETKLINTRGVLSPTANVRNSLLLIVNKLYFKENG